MSDTHATATVNPKAAHFEPLAKTVIESLGGVENIRSVGHCATRLRCTVYDDDAVSGDMIGKIPGVLQYMKAGGQHQVVIGNDVPFAYEAVVAQPGMSSKGTKEASTEESEAPEEKSGEKKNIFNAFIDLISAIIQPFLWVLAGVALIKAFTAVAAQFGILDQGSTTYQVLYATGDGIFHFLPIFIAVTSARKFKVNEFLALAVIAPLVYPSIVELAGESGLHLFGIPFMSMDYTSTLIPAILAIWVTSYVARFFEKYLPSAVRNFGAPLLTVLIMVPVVLLVVGPVTVGISNLISNVITAVYGSVPWLAGGLLGAFWQVLVIFGMHWSIVPIMLNDINVQGSTFIMAPIFSAVLAQSAATFAVFVRTKNAERRAMSGPAALSGFLAGVTEPVVYGVNLPMKLPFYIGCVGGAIGGIFSGFAGTRADAFVFPSLISIPAAMNIGNVPLFLIGVAVAVVVGFVGTFFIVGHVEKKEKAEEEQALSESQPSISTSAYVVAPVSGTIIPTETIDDKVFASGAMGMTVAINPEDGVFTAPVAGTVIAVQKTGHAYGIRGDNGAEILLHVGIDTVRMGGEGFTPAVTQGEHVAVGDTLVDVDLSAITKAGFSTTTMVVVTNSKSLPGLSADRSDGHVTCGEEIFQLKQQAEENEEKK